DGAQPGLPAFPTRRSSDLPVPLMLVLPELRLNADSAGGCNVDTGDQQYSAEQIASMDRVIKSEFRKRLPREIAQSVSSMLVRGADRKSTRLNSSHVKISYA